MKIKNTPTDHILIKAKSNDPTHYCAFAILFISNEWRKTMLHRLENIRPFAHDSTLHAHTYADGTASYYKTVSRDTYFDTELFLSDTAEEDWAFVELSREELKEFEGTETILTNDLLHLFPDGTACFQSIAPNKVHYTTAKFRVMQLVSKIALLK
jgi:hypothetical protein